MSRAPSQYRDPMPLLCKTLLAALAILANVSAPAAETLAATTIKPVHSLVAGVIGDDAKVALVLTDMQSPHEAQLRPAQVKALHSNAVLFYIDDSLETFMVSTLSSLPDKVRTVSLARLTGIKTLPARPAAVWPPTPPETLAPEPSASRAGHPPIQPPPDSPTSNGDQHHHNRDDTHGHNREGILNHNNNDEPNQTKADTHSPTEAATSNQTEADTHSPTETDTHSQTEADTSNQTETDAHSLGGVDVHHQAGVVQRSLAVSGSHSLDSGKALGGDVARHHSAGEAGRHDRDSAHSRTRGGIHNHGDNDMHIWLDVGNAKIMVRAIADELVSIYPEHTQAFTANARRLLARLDQLDAQLRQTLAGLSDKPFVVSHDAFQYLERRYGLQAVGSISLTPDTPPSLKRLREVRTQITHSGALCLFSEPQFPARLLEAVRQDNNIRTGTLDPLGADIEPGQEMYFSLMHSLAQNIRQCLD